MHGLLFAVLTGCFFVTPFGYVFVRLGPDLNFWDEATRVLVVGMVFFVSYVFTATCLRAAEVFDMKCPACNIKLPWHHHWKPNANKNLDCPECCTQFRPNQLQLDRNYWFVLLTSVLYALPMGYLVGLIEPELGLWPETILVVTAWVLVGVIYAITSAFLWFEYEVVPPADQPSG